MRNFEDAYADFLAGLADEHSSNVGSSTPLETEAPEAMPSPMHSHRLTYTRIHVKSATAKTGKTTVSVTPEDFARMTFLAGSAQAAKVEVRAAAAHVQKQLLSGGEVARWGQARVGVRRSDLSAKVRDRAMAVLRGKYRPV